MVWETETFEGPVDDWKNQIISEIGEQFVYFRETGAQGWSKLVVNNGVPDFEPSSGPHYIDVAPRNDHPFQSACKLVGTYNVYTSVGKFFRWVVIKSSPVD
jgi:hypothetical protein